MGASAGPRSLRLVSYFRPSDVRCVAPGGLVGRLSRNGSERVSGAGVPKRPSVRIGTLLDLLGFDQGRGAVL